MGFATGQMTFKRFFVQGAASKRVDEALLDKLSTHAINADNVQTADQKACGWTTGVHILDTQFDWSKNVSADGLHFALRIDTNKPPTELLRSYQKINEQSMLEASGREFLSKAERREARDQARARAEAETRSGAFKRMKQVAVFWDVQRREVYLGSTALSVIDDFILLFARTFDRSIVPASAGELASRWASRAGQSTMLDQCQPAHFINPPDGIETSDDLLHTGEGANFDYLGTEWLTWLWYTSHVETPEVKTGGGQPITVLFEKSMQIECAFKMSGSLSISATGPTRLPETPIALATGKLPVRAGLQIAVQGEVFGFCVRGDAMNISGLLVPPPQEAGHPRVIFEERMDHLRHFIKAIDALYTTFLKRRLSSKWSQTLSAMRTWIASGQLTSQAPAKLGAAS